MPLVKRIANLKPGEMLWSSRLIKTSAVPDGISVTKGLSIRGHRITYVDYQGRLRDRYSVAEVWYGEGGKLSTSHILQGLGIVSSAEELSKFFYERRRRTSVEGSSIHSGGYTAAVKNPIHLKLKVYVYFRSQMTPFIRRGETIITYDTYGNFEKWTMDEDSGCMFSDGGNDLNKRQWTVLSNDYHVVSRTTI